MVRHFRKRMLMGKAHEKHSDTKLFTIGPATALVSEHTMRDTEVGQRDPDGADTNIQANRTFGQECNIGDSCKFINIHIQAGPRKDDSSTSAGWIEWAFACHKASDDLPTIVNTGVQTLGDCITKYLRNECIYTGAIAVGRAQPTVAEITLKIPKNKITLRAGDVWRLYLIARTVSATDTDTNTFRVITSCNYINYH